MMFFDEKFAAWKDQIKATNEAEAEFEKWLFVHVSGVLFADKDGELLMLAAQQFDLSMARRLRIIGRLAKQWGYSWRMLCQNETSTKVIIYNRERVKASLASVHPCYLCAKLNYGPRPEPEAFLAELARRWQESGDIPHEIGLALGYPVKDVLGYMGLMPLPCTGTCGWQIYGDPKPSLQRSRQFVQAQQQATRFVAV